MLPPPCSSATRSDVQPRSRPRRQYFSSKPAGSQRGRTKIVINGRISEYIPNPTFEVIARPGAMEDYFRHGNPEGKDRRAIFGEPMRSIPAFREPGPRVELMDEQGIDRSLLFPTLA